MFITEIGERFDDLNTKRFEMTEDRVEFFDLLVS